MPFKSSQNRPPLNAWGSLRCHLRLWVALLAVLAGDLASKHYVFARLGEPPAAGLTILPGALEFQTQYNLGAALGILQGHRNLFVVAGAVAIAVFLLMFARSGSGQWFMHLGIALVLGGALGNAYDRLVLGKVRDFIHITLCLDVDLLWGWPRGGVYPWVFNVADVALVVGVAMMAISLWHWDRRGAARAAGLEKQKARR